jgi:transcription antitermination protein NusB
MGNRRKSRELVLQMLFQSEMGKQTRDQVRASFWKERTDVEEDVRGFADDLFGVATEEASAEKIDKLIEESASNWRLDRMAAVDRNLLRAAVAEMIGYPQTPKPIIINEAIEIARKYSNPESVNFINGVLDSVGKSLAER